MHEHPGALARFDRMLVIDDADQVDLAPHSGDIDDAEQVFGIANFDDLAGYA